MVRSPRPSGPAQVATSRALATSGHHRAPGVMTYGCGNLAWHAELGCSCVLSRSLERRYRPGRQPHHAGGIRRPGLSGRVAQMVRARRFQRCHARRSRHPVDQRRQAFLQVESGGWRVAGVDARRREWTCVTGRRKLFRGGIGQVSLKRSQGRQPAREPGRGSPPCQSWWGMRSMALTRIMRSSSSTW